MAKTLVKIVLALLLINAAFHIGNAYWNYYKFEDALEQLALFGDRRTDRQLCDQAVETAAGYSVPITADALVIRRGNNPPFGCGDGGTTAAPTIGQASTQMTIEGSYVQQVQIVPGYTRQWEFKPNVKVWLRL